MEEKHNSPATTADAATPSSAELPSSRRRGGGLKRKASILSNSNASTPPPSLSSKRQAREKPSPVLFPPIHNGPCTRARQQPNYADATSFWEAVIVNGEGEGSILGTPVAAAKVEEELNARKEAWEALEAKMEAEYDHVKSRDANSHVVPISCGWFSWTKVHQLEEKTLASFFNGKVENRTPELYMDIRNSIMKRFHENPNTQIEAKDLSEISIGELDAKKEVMEFLDYWGLINYHPFPEADITNSMGDAEEAAKIKSLIQNLYEFEVEQLCPPAAPRTSLATVAVPSRLPESMITDESVQPEGPSVEYHCNSCAADCSRKRYHCQKQADFDLCTDCFKDGKFDSDMSPSDFIIMEPADAAGASSGKWTDQETLLLLEALELFSENWNEIAEHVATKTKAQCILHFIQMPIEDTFRDCDDEEDDDANHKEKAEKKDASPDENGEKKEVDASLEENGEKEVDVNLKEKTDAVAIKNDKPLSDSLDMKEADDPKAIVNTDALPTDDIPSNNDEPDSIPMDISESVDPGKLKDNQEENGVNIAVKALREAFDAVGSRPSTDGKLSFADASNPVMTMAAFLSRLVDPNVVTASARTSLKSVSSGGTGLHLSARHSFVIEHPTDEKKPDDNERDVQETVEQEGMKDETDSGKKQEEEKSGLIHSKSSVNDNNDKECNNLSGKDKELSVSHEEKKDPIPAEVVIPKKGKNVGRKGVSASSKKDKDPVAEKPIIPEGTNEQKDKVENPSSSKKESEDSADGTEAPKDEEMVSKSLPLETAEPSESNILLAENTANSAEAGAKDGKNVNEEHPLETKDDPDMHKLTLAAVTAISAAAVKAKFLADQEEDQIRQLATSLIEKQLHKLETKLAFFTEMDAVVSRVREQLERSKQRLYHERAQIIAARLGMSSAANTRPMPHPLPNRGAMPFPNAVQRPPNPMSMTPQRPPLSRPMMAAPTPPFSNPIIPGTVAGNSAQISNNQDKLSSSVGMK